jgi:hypothetical protein
MYFRSLPAGARTIAAQVNRFVEAVFLGRIRGFDADPASAEQLLVNQSYLPLGLATGRLGCEITMGQAPFVMRI